MWIAIVEYDFPFNYPPSAMPNIKENPMIRSDDLCRSHRVSVGMQASPQPPNDTRKLPCSLIIDGKSAYG